MSRENKHAYKEGFWREHSAAWKLSGLTQVAYCAQQGIGYRGFVYQHKRMAMKSEPSALGFVEAKPQTVETSSQTASLQLMLPNGIRIGVANDVNPILLKTVLAIAGGISC